MRYTEIIEELSDYDPSVKAARVGSTVAIGEIVEMAKAADTIERIQSERTFWHEKWRRDWRALNEARAEVERLKGEKSEILVKLQMARADLEAEARSLGYTG